MRLTWLLLIVTRLRDRLRCPVCSAVGTFKLHAPTKDANGGNVPWRWLCKFCGYYKSSEKSGMLCYPSRSQKCWVFFTDGHPDELKLTPREALSETLGTVWPWRG